MYTSILKKTWIATRVMFKGSLENCEMKIKTIGKGPLLPHMFKIFYLK